jgi:hypothetical protein
MRRGCISLGWTKCDDCQRTIPHPDRYLAMEKGDIMNRFCVDCSIKKGYARYKVDRGETTLTFFEDEMPE